MLITLLYTSLHPKSEVSSTRSPKVLLSEWQANSNNFFFKLINCFLLHQNQITKHKKGTIYLTVSRTIDLLLLPHSHNSNHPHSKTIQKTIQHIPQTPKSNQIHGSLQLREGKLSNSIYPQFLHQKFKILQSHQTVTVFYFITDKNYPVLINNNTNQTNILQWINKRKELRNKQNQIRDQIRKT